MTRPTRADFIRGTAAAYWLANPLRRAEECVAGATELARHLPPECFAADGGTQPLSSSERDALHETIRTLDRYWREAQDTFNAVRAALCADPQQAFVSIEDAAERAARALAEKDQRIAELEAGASAVTTATTEALRARVAELEEQVMVLDAQRTRTFHGGDANTRLAVEAEREACAAISDAAGQVARRMADDARANSRLPEAAAWDRVAYHVGDVGQAIRHRARATPTDR